MLDALIDHKDDLGDRIADAVTADAKVGTCPKCGKDLVMKTSAKTRGSLIGCMGWPDCDVTYPVPSGVKVSPLEGEAAVCPECGPRASSASRSGASVRDLREPPVPHQLRARPQGGRMPHLCGRRQARRPHRPQVGEKRQALHPLHQLRRMRRLLPLPARASSRRPARCASIVARPSWWSRRRAALGASASTWTARLKSRNRPWARARGDGQGLGQEGRCR